MQNGSGEGSKVPELEFDSRAAGVSRLQRPKPGWLTPVSALGRQLRLYLKIRFRLEPTRYGEYGGRTAGERQPKGCGFIRQIAGGRRRRRIMRKTGWASGAAPAAARPARAAASQLVFSLPKHTQQEQPKITNSHNISFIHTPRRRASCVHSSS